MMTELRNLSLASRIYRLSGTVVLIFLLVIGWLFFQFREGLYEARRQELKSWVESGWHLLEFYAQQVANGSLTSEEARQHALQVIRSQHFEKEKHLWIADLTPTMVMHPLHPELEGRDLAHYLDPSGRPLFLEMVEVVGRDGAGFVEYLWPRPGEAESVAKISFVKEFPAWGWMIGAGSYVDDIDSYLLRLVFGAGAVLVVVIVGALLLVAFVSRSISVPMSRAVAMIEALEHGDLNHRLRLTQQDEVGRLAKSLDAFADNLQDEILTAFDHLARGDFSFAAQGLIREPLAKTNVRLNALIAKLDLTAAEALEERSKTEALIAAIGEGVAIFNAEKKFVYQNPIHIDLAGRHVGEPCSRAFHEDEHACDECAVARTLNDGQIHKMERRVSIDGRVVYIDVTASPVRDAAGKIISVIEIARDITERKQVEANIQYLALHDPLTGLANRTLLEDRLTLALAQARRGNEEGAIFFIDLDRFKLINDSLGHHAGDLLLQAVGKRLQALVRTTDTVCRSGGDEFILLFLEIDGPTAAAHLAEKILASFTAPFVIAEREIFISFSVGISLYPGDGADSVTLIQSADAAMYLAKEQGGHNFQFFTPALTHAAQERLLLENSLRQALAGDELLLHYQPQFAADSGAIIGVEAMARWYHPLRGWISPATFIPIAEESGLIEVLGAWVLRTACAQNKQWQVRGYAPLRMAVKVSGRQFRQRDFIEVVDRILAETGLDPHWLEMEMTENILMENVHETILTLSDLKARQISLAIDDFGTGYSSLSYLRQFPIDRLKIDRSFVTDITSNADAAAIASAVISLAKTLNLEVIAEGVETVEQMQLLQKKECDAMQGYYFSRPVPPDEMQALLSDDEAAVTTENPFADG